MKKLALLAATILSTAVLAQPPVTHTASVETSVFWSSPGDGEDLLVVYGWGVEAGKLVIVRDPALFAPPLIPVRLEPVWVYAKETRQDRLGLRPCFHALADDTCEAAKSFPLNIVAYAGNMAPLECAPSMPHYTVWRIDYPGGAPWRGGIGAPELVVVWFRVVML